MNHTPYGYRIENGKAVIDTEAVEQIKTLYHAYLSGDYMDTAAKKASIGSSHGGIGRMLQNRHYLGDEYYLAIIDLDTFSAAEAERIKRASHLGRFREPKEKAGVLFPTSFHLNEGTEQYDDPFQQAEYSYSLSESEVNNNGTKDDDDYSSSSKTNPSSNGKRRSAKA